MTSPAVGSLYGNLVARALDRWWDTLGHPDPYIVVDAGAGDGRLWRDVLRATPRCAPALRAVLVERSAALRAAQRDRLPIEPFEDALGAFEPSAGGDAPVPVPRLGPVVTALDELPAVAVEGVVLANELLDNLPFDVVERSHDGWLEIRVGADAEGRLCEVPVPAAPDLQSWLGDLVAPVGARVPVQRSLETWLGACGAVLRRGFAVVIDYAASLADIVARSPGWLRCYRAHERLASPLDDPGEHDVTADLVLEVVRRSAARAGFTIVRETTQAGWLAELGVAELVAEARRRWSERAAVGDLEALSARSRIGEAEALTDPAGLGGHTVVVLTKGLGPGELAQAPLA